jgi:hypothetical protein
MACFSVTKLGFLTVTEIIDDIVTELTGNVAGGATNTIQYFQPVFDGTNSPTESSNRVIVLKTTYAIDPLANAAAVGTTSISNVEPGWRVCFNIEDNGGKFDRVNVHVGTILQLTDTGAVARRTTRAATSSQEKEPVGNMVDNWTGGGSGSNPQPTNLTEYWLNRSPTDDDNAGAYPMNYMLTLTNRGIFLAIWEGSQEEIPQGLFPNTSDNTNPDSAYGYGNSPLRWLLIQRPVDRLTGHVRGGAALRQSANTLDETSRCPVIAISGYGSSQKYKKLVVREADVVVPSRKKLVTLQTEDQPAMLNPYQQQSLTESGEFIVTFINSIGTSRFRYADELDMLGTVSAKVIGAGTSIIVRVYEETEDGTPTGEPTYREYTALYSTERYGNGMRLMVLTRVGVDINNPTDTGPTAQARNIAVENSHIDYTP